MSKYANSELQLIAIKTKDKIFISDNISNYSYHNSQIKNFLFDGVQPTQTYRDSWFTIPNLPSKVEKRVPPQRINVRYELKSQFPESELTPKVINESYIDEDSPYAEIIGLYEQKYDLTEETLEEVKFKINIIEELEQFEITKQEYDLKFNFLDTLNYHPVLLPTRPCKLTKEESYKIIRNHVKNNIDPRYAYISSDYDFCFTVMKRIKLYKPEEYEVNINSGTRRKAKYEKRYKQDRSVKIYEVAPKPYQSYPVVQEFYGKNEEDLKNNIKTFLNELMDTINKPVVECEHCQGLGVILNEQS